MGLLSLFSKKSKSETNYSTSNKYQDSSVNAGGAGSVALGEGAALEINTESLDPEVAKSAIETTGGVAAFAIDSTSGVAKAALGSNVEVTKESLKGFERLAGKVADNSSNLALATINVVSDAQELASKDKEYILNAATLQNQNIAATAERLAELAVGNVAESKKDPDNATLEKVGRYAAFAAVAVVLGLAIITKGKK